MAQLQALIFDVDGTLADTERDGHRVAFNRAFAASQLDWDWSTELYGELLAVTGGKERIQHYIDRHNPTLPDATGDRRQMIADLHALKTLHYKQLIQEGTIPLRPGVKRLILEARQQGMRLAIATTTTPANVIALLEATLGVDSPTWFETIAAGDVVPAKKPAPDIFYYALQEMKLPPEQCLAIEDSSNGLIAAVQAGLPTVVTLNDYTAAQDFSQAALVVDHLGEPDLPFRVIAGDVGDATYLDLALARKLLGE